jgi:hypothetical protein
VISKVHRQLGTAGFVIAIVALIAALGGGAYAASGGFSGKQKKEIRNIAKQEARKVAVPGPQGSAGTPGAQGLPGAQGSNGTDGADGTDGTDGTDGESVSIIPLAPDNGTGECEDGGAKFINGTGEGFACNGKNGVSAEGTATGAWESQGENGFVLLDTFVVSTISFPSPLATAPTETILIDEDATEDEKLKCPGEIFEPKATPGILCLYPAGGAPTVTPGGPGAQTFGAVVFFPKTYEMFGSWAVQAA